MINAEIYKLYRIIPLFVLKQFFYAASAEVNLADNGLSMPYRSLHYTYNAKNDYLVPLKEEVVHGE